MSFLARLALLFVLVPLLELALLVKLGQVVGLWPTLALVVLTGVGGAALARAQGLRVLLSFREELGRGRLPGQAIFDGAAVLVGGAFLLTPGLLTDAAGLSLLFPPTRRWLQRAVRRRLEEAIREGRIELAVMARGAESRPPGGTPSEADFDYVDLTDDTPPDRR